MSRSGYDDYDYGCDAWDMIRWRGAVASAIKGRRGQAFFRAMKEALDALPGKRLIAGDLVRDGECCAMGALALHRGMDVGRVDPGDRNQVAKLFDIAPALAAEAAYENDGDFHPNMLPETRYARVYRWVLACLKEGPSTDGASAPRGK